MLRLLTQERDAQKLRKGAVTAHETQLRNLETTLTTIQKKKKKKRGKKEKEKTQPKTKTDRKQEA